MQSHIAICPSICKKGKFTAKEGSVRIGKKGPINAIGISQSLPIVLHILLVDVVLTFPAVVHDRYQIIINRLKLIYLIVLRHPGTST